MSKKISELLHGKNINFLIGSGAASPLYPTLSLGEEMPSFEDLITSVVSLNHKNLLYAYFIKKLVYPIVSFKDMEDDKYDNTINNYKRFMKSVIGFLNNEGNDKPKRVNIFTTNYDLMFENAYDQIIKDTQFSFFNDGGRGAITRHIDIKNYNLGILYDGYNNRYRREMPSLNLYKMHGSLSWLKTDENDVIIDYSMRVHLNNFDKFNNDILSNDLYTNIENFFKKNTPLKLGDLTNKYKEFYDEQSKNNAIDEDKLSEFGLIAQKMPIIYPTKRKFHDTVFEQQYYQMLRLFSYELEKVTSVLIVFGFSFADEHILEIFKRTMLNPTLEVYVIQYDKKTANRFSEIFCEYKNIHFYPKSFENEEIGDWDYLIKIMDGIVEIEEANDND